MQAQVKNLLHAGREEHRQAAGLEDVVTLMRGGRAFGNMVVTRHRNHATPGCGARHIGVLENVRRAVHTRPLAVPHTEHAIVLVGAGRCKAQLLRAPDGCSRQLFIHARLKHNVLRFQVLGSLPQGLVITAEW